MTYTVTVTESPVCIAHQLHLPYESKCNSLHGHNYTVEVCIIADALDSNGMVVDFTLVKSVIKQYDHKFLGRKGPAGQPFMPCDPSTAENFASLLLLTLQSILRDQNAVYRGSAKVDHVSVWETPNNKVTVLA